MILFLFYKSIFFRILNNIMLFKNDKSCSITYMEQNGSIRQIVYQSVHWEMGAYYYTIVVEKKKIHNNFHILFLFLFSSLCLFLKLNEPTECKDYASIGP